MRLCPLPAEITTEFVVRALQYLIHDKNRIRFLVGDPPLLPSLGRGRPSYLACLGTDYSFPIEIPVCRDGELR